MKWKQEELILLREKYPVLNERDLLILFNGRTYQSLKIKASILGIEKKIFHRNGYNSWTDEEEDLLWKFYPHSTKDEIIKYFPARSYASINLKACLLGIRKSWSTKKYKGTAVHPYVLGDLSKLLEETPEVYYWIGFLLADGHFAEHCVCLNLAKKDGEHLRRFVEFLGCNYYIGIKSFGMKVQDKITTKKIVSKFQIDRRKTYNPPSVSVFERMPRGLFLSCLVGYIDGDGCIKRQSANRKDCCIAIKLHASWLGVLNYFSMRLSKEFGIKMAAAKINNRGYARINICSRKVVSGLKKWAGQLPCLKRKWDRIDETLVLGYNPSVEMAEKIRGLCHLRNKDIARELGVHASYVSKLSKQYAIKIGNLK